MADDGRHEQGKAADRAAEVAAVVSHGIDEWAEMVTDWANAELKAQEQQEAAQESRKAVKGAGQATADQGE
jgi:hypothetical protein